MFMNHILTIITLCGCLLLSGGCGHKKHVDTSREPSHGGHDTHLHLELNNGQKWQVDDHTRQSAENLLHLIEETPLIASARDAEALAKAFDEELSTLVRGCTMTGPAHDQLHVFLTALFPKVAELKDDTSVKDLQTVRDEIDSLLAAYQGHFN